MDPNEKDLPESSPGSDTDVQAAEADAISSGADQDEGEGKSLLDVVRSALNEPGDEDEGEEKPEPAESSTAEVAGQESEESDEGPEKDQDAALIELLDNLKDGSVPLNKIQRFREILEDRKQLKAKWDQVAPAIDRLQEINQAARLAGLEPDDLADFYAAPLLAKQDPTKAREAIARLAGKLGLSEQPLPPDLQRKVDDGYLDEASAREVIAARREAEDAKREARLKDEDRQREAQQQLVRSMGDAVNRYQQSLIENDPDYSPAVHKLVRKELERLMFTQGRPESVDGALSMAKSAYETVKSDLAPLRSVPKPKSTPSGRRINAPAVSAPKSMEEAIARALQQQ